MNRLRGFRCYLIGPMDRVTDGGVGWRRDFSEFLRELDITPLDPTKKPMDEALESTEAIALRKVLLEEERYDEVAKSMKQIRGVDLRLCDICDFAVVYLPLDVVICGSWEELFWCNRMKKPVLAMVPQGKKHAPHWLFGTIPHQHIFGSWQDVKKYLIEVDCASEVDHMRRWCFLDYDRLKA